MSADSSRRSRAVFVLFPQRALSSSFALPPSYVASASPATDMQRTEEVHIFWIDAWGWVVSGTIRVIGWSLNTGFICAANFVTSFWTHVHIIFYPTFYRQGPGGGDKSRRNCDPQCFVDWQGGPLPHINKSAAAAVVVRHLRPLASSLFLVTRTAQSSSSLLGRHFFLGMSA
jgi:hypothetical protein